MKGKFLRRLISLGMVAACSMMTAVSASAAGSTEYMNNLWVFRAVADVQTSVNIRANASTDSTIVGYLTKAACADILERGTEWSKVISGGVEGYVKNEYLAFGEDAEYLANVYGMPGVKTYWDGVCLFAEPSAAAEIIGRAGNGQEFEVISNNGIWVSVWMDDETIAYVPAEDVMETIILDRAVSLVGESYNAGNTGSYESGSSYTENNYSTSGSDNSYSDNSYSDNSYTAPETYVPETSAPETYVPETSAPETYVPETSAPTTEAPETEAPASSNNTTSVSASDRELLAGIIYCEAGNQSRTGKVAVGAVVMNRVASSSFANTIKGVIYERGQFTPAGSGWLDSVIANGAIPDSCYEAADAALAGENPVGGALFFNGGTGKGMQIGDHQFY